MSLHDSIPPGCEPACHGCRHRHLSPAASLEQKAGYLARALAPWQHVLGAIHAVPPEQRFGYRDRVTLNARWDDAIGWRFGLMRREELIPIPTCPVQTRRVNAFMALLRETLPSAERFPLAYVHVAGAQATLIVKSRRYTASHLESLHAGLAGSGLDGCWVHCHPCAGRKLFARSGWHLFWGSATSIGADGLQHGPTAFQQLLPELHAASMQAALEHLRPHAGAAVLDLYCGIGATLRTWATHGADVLGIELAGGAVAAAMHNAPQAQVLRGTCVQRLPQVLPWWNAHGGSRVIYLNPPRSGLEAEVADAIVNDLRPDRMAYLSCSAGTLARDLGTCVASGYTVDRLLPFDFFPLTQHVECLALLSRPDSIHRSA